MGTVPVPRPPGSCGVEGLLCEVRSPLFSPTPHLAPKSFSDWPGLPSSAGIGLYSKLGLVRPPCADRRPLASVMTVNEIYRDKKIEIFLVRSGDQAERVFLEIFSLERDERKERDRER